MKKFIHIYSLFLISVLVIYSGCKSNTAAPDNDPPSIQLNYPPEYTFTSVSGTITISADVSDNDAVSSVDFFLIISDTLEIMETDTIAPFTLNWDTTLNDDCSTYLICAIAYDFSGDSKQSAIHTFNVDNSADSDIAVQVWLTEGGGTARLEQQPNRYFGTNCGNSNIIEITSSQLYQQIDGFGAALTHSSAWLIDNSPNRDLIIEKLFSKTDGIGISYTRLAMGSSDFVNGSHYSYAETPNDMDLSEFSIDRDRENIIPLLQDILMINPNLKIMGSPWSAPGWMKTSGQFVCGNLWDSRLKTEMYAVYADYFVKFVEEYALQGIPIDAITIQNEPLYCPGNYPGMIMSGEEQRDFVKYHLGPKFEENGINTKIVIFDHNWDGDDQTGAYDFIEAVYNDPLAVSYIDGTAFHGYGNGDANFQSVIYNINQNKSIYFTERTNISDWDNWEGVLGHISKYYFIDVLNNWSKNVLLWNLALDSENGPYNGGCDVCTGLVTVDGSQLDYEIDYYITGHFSRFVESGAFRIGSTNQVNGVEAVAFQNPDGSKSLIAVNTDENPKSFYLMENGLSLFYNLPSQALATFVW